MGMDVTDPSNASVAELPAVRIVPATRADVPAMLTFVRELATYEQSPGEVATTEADLDIALFGPHPAAEAIVAWIGHERVGFALFFHNFSTWTGRRGIYLEDLYVRDSARGRGVGRALLAALARIAVERGCPRLEWIVLDWNAPAIRFYRAIGAGRLDDWETFRLDGEAVRKLAESPPDSPS